MTAAAALRLVQDRPATAAHIPVETLPSAERGIVRTPIALAHGGVVDAAIRWERIGAPGLPHVVVQGGISADRHVGANRLDGRRGWWSDHVTTSGSLCPHRHAVLAIDWLGGDGTLDAPVDTADQADAVAAVLDALRVPRLAAWVGASYGAMVGLRFAARHGARLGRHVAISGAHRAHPDAVALRVVQRRIVGLGGGSPAALALARALAMLGYRSAAEIGSRFDAPPSFEHGAPRFAVEGWLDACGARFASSFPPNAFLRLSESIDLHRLDPASIRVPTTVVAVREDRLVPHADLAALARAIPDARLVTIRSRYGHDAFLKEHGAVAAVLRRALRGAA